MSAATQIAYSDFDRKFLKLPPHLQKTIQNHLDDLGSRLNSFPHYKMKGSSYYRLRIGDYRVLYTFDTTKNILHLVYVAHRKEVYRGI